MVPSSSIVENSIVYDIVHVGNEDWNIQLKQSDLTLEQGSTYTLKFDATSTKDRIIKWALLSTSYEYYDGDDIPLYENQKIEVQKTFTVSKDTNQAIDFVVSMGQIFDASGNPINTQSSSITLTNFSLIKEEIGRAHV